jgi:hypothetical protein
VSAKGLRQEVRDRLASVVSQAQRAQRMALTNDNLCDLLDEIDNEVQAVIKLVERARGVTS